MRKLPLLFENNRRWSESMRQRDPDFFNRLRDQQSPAYLWIGCSDSRVPANEIVDLLPGEMFVHRNVANVVVYTDLNCLSVMQYAVDVLKVRHIIVCGHYGCGGVGAALRGERAGLVDNWLRHVQDVRDKHTLLVAAVAENQRWDLLCELNVIEQAANVCQTTVVQDAWKRGQPLTVHGWIYGLRDGLLKDLGVCASADSDLLPDYRATLEKLSAKHGLVAPGASLP
jgi:carbonic anhydrase